MIKKIYKSFKKSNQQQKLNELKIQIEELRKKNDIIAFVPDNTGYSWLGIKNGAKALFPEKTVCLPQYYSNSIFNHEELYSLCKTIVDLRFKKIIFRGFPLYFEELIKNLNQLNKNIEIYLLFGGFLSEFSINESAKISFLKFIEMAQLGFVKKIGFNKNGLAETVEKLYDVKASQYFNKTSINIKKNIGFNSNKQPSIGVLANTDFRKNIDNQVAAALMVENVKVFVKSKQHVSYLDRSKSRLIEFPKTLPHNDYVNLLHSMTLNMYVSFSESWGHVIMESMAGGIPCLASDTSSIFDDNKFLRERLVVEKFDDSFKIYQKAEAILENYDELALECCNYVQDINQRADKIMNSFLFDE